MRIPSITALVLAFLPLAVGGCATATEPLAPLADPPRLLGRWAGSWGGTMTHPMEMEVEKQRGAEVTGTVTYTTHGRTTYGMAGTIGARKDGTVWLSMGVMSAEFLLKVVSDQRLEGTGRSPSHVGPVVLTRE